VADKAEIAFVTTLAEGLCANEIDVVQVGTSAEKQTLSFS
jgi:hypothetical protein